MRGIVSVGYVRELSEGIFTYGKRHPYRHTHTREHTHRARSTLRVTDSGKYDQGIPGPKVPGVWSGRRDTGSGWPDAFMS